MEYALSNHEELDDWFSEVKKWDRYESCTTRKAWLEVIGVPPHGWCWETFKKIAEVWGVLISLSKPILRTDTFDSMKLLVETNILSSIEWSFVLHIEDLGYQVHVREVNSAFSIIREAKVGGSHIEEDVDSTGDVPGFEDLDVSVESKNAEPQCDQGIRNHQMEGSKHPEDDKRRTRRNSNSNIEEANEEPVFEVQEEGINSDTRTKTAQLINNECSEDVMMNLNKTVPLKTGEEGIMINVERSMGEDDSILVPPGFEPVGMEKGSRPIKTTTVQRDGPQIKCPMMDHSEPLDEGDNNWATEDSRATQISKNGAKKVTQRSRSSKGMEKISSESTSASWDSCKRLANEALQIGELLGIKVVKNKKAALAELAESIGRKKVTSRRKINKDQ